MKYLSSGTEAWISVGPFLTVHFKFKLPLLTLTSASPPTWMSKELYKVDGT